MNYRDKFFTKYVSGHTYHLYGEISLEDIRNQFQAWSAYFGKILPLEREARILDIGCGDGGLVYWLQSAGYKMFMRGYKRRVGQTKPLLAWSTSNDIYKVEVDLCNELVGLYDKSARQLFKLAEAWDKFKNRRRRPSTDNETGRDNV